MTQAERDVIDAARAAVCARDEGRVTVFDIVHEGDKLGALVRAVMRLERERSGGGYWRER